MYVTHSARGNQISSDSSWNDICSNDICSDALRPLAIACLQIAHVAERHTRMTSSLRGAAK